MKRTAALKLVEKCVDAELRRLAFDANLYRKNMVKSPATERAYEQYERLAVAWRVVAAPLQIGLISDD